MNPEFPQNEHAKLEAKLTALLLGELHASEIAALSQAMEKDPELAALYERLKVTIELVREGAMQPKAEEQAPLKMSAEKREKLLASFKTVAPKEFAKPRRALDWLVPWAAVATIALFFGWLLVPNFIKTRSTARSNTIINNLRLLDGAKQQWALENHKPADAVPTMADLAPYMGRGGDVNIGSVAGEKYVLGKVSEEPKVEASVSQAKRLFGPEIVSHGEVRDGKVIVSPMDNLAQNQAAAPNTAVGVLNPADTAPQQQVASAPAATPPPATFTVVPAQKDSPAVMFGRSATAPTTPIVLPQQSDFSVAPGQSVVLGGNVIQNQGASPVVISGGLEERASQQSSLFDVPAGSRYKLVTDYAKLEPETLTAGTIVVTNGTAPNSVTFNADSFETSKSYQALSKLGADAERGKGDWTVDTHNKVGEFALADGSVAQVSAEGLKKALAESNVVYPTLSFDDSKVPVLGDVPSVGRVYKSNSSLAWNGGFNTASTRGDVNGLRYQMTNADSARIGTLEEAAASNSSGFVGRYAYIAPPSTSDGLLTSGLRTPAHVGGVVQGENQIVLPGGDGSLALNDEKAKEAPRAGGSRFPMIGPASGGKQVELAAANAPKLQPPDAVTASGGTMSEAEQKVVENFTKSAPYFAAKEELDHAKNWRQTLALKANAEAVDVNLPRLRMVTVMDRATPAAPKESSFGEKIKETLTGKVERTASIQVEQEHPDIGGVAGASVGASYDPYFLQTEFETIKSDAVLSRVVEKLNLDGGDKSKTKAAEEQLKKNLDLGNVKNTKLIAIGAKSEKAEDAARIANAVAEAYRDFRSQEYEDLKNRGVNSLHDQLAEQDKKIAVMQARVDELEKSLGASSASELMSFTRLKELSTLKIQKEAEYNQQETLLKNLKGMDKAALRRALPIAYSDTQLNELLAEYDHAQQALLKVEIDYAPDHPKYKSAAAAVSDLDHKIDERVDGVMTGLEAQVAFRKSYLETLQNDMAAAQQARVRTNDVEALARANDTALPKPAVPPPTPQPEVLTRENAFSTFSLNVSDVSFKLAAASLEKGQMPEPASIRSEEFINAFDYRDPDAAPGVPIAFASERARYPFAHNRELLRFSLKTAAAGRQQGRPLNIVLLLDNSGSMERADRVSIIREALRVLAGQLQAGDTFSIVTFARTAQLRVDGIPGDQAAAAAEEIAKLTPEGGTNLGDALELAYQTALRHYLANGDNRVVLLTDGAANLGDVNPDVLKQKVEAHRQQGVALDCFGIGWEGYNDDLLEVLTRNGDGRYGFINTPEEANTEFVSQIAGALHVAAADVKVQVEFNPQRVTSYRQIGYAKHQLTKEQFRDNTVDAAEVAAQEAGNALYTIEINPDGSGSIATVRVRYKVPGTVEYREQSWDVPYTGGAAALDQSSPAMRLAATACAFSEWLATSPFAADVSTDQLLKYINGVPKVYGADARPAKLESMIRQAKSISGK